MIPEKLAKRRLEFDDLDGRARAIVYEVPDGPVLSAIMADWRTLADRFNATELARNLADGGEVPRHEINDEEWGIYEAYTGFWRERTLATIVGHELNGTDDGTTADELRDTIEAWPLRWSPIVEALQSACFSRVAWGDDAPTFKVKTKTALVS